MCSPMRTRTLAPRDQSVAKSSRCASQAAATPCGALGNTTKKLSPSVPISVPPCVAIAARMMRRWSDSTVA